MFRSSSSSFDKMLEKATSNLRLEPDWMAIMQICDLIRQGDSQPKYAIAAIKKKIYHTNPHVAMYALLVLESVVKNCGSPVHEEVGTKQFMEELREMVQSTGHDKVKMKILEMIQAWAHAFRNSPKYRAVQDAINIMKAEGYKFPALKESDAMFVADTAPEWADGDCCHRCRVQFGVVQRKHHCRACGQVFCGKCSARNCTLPKFGIEKEVRVCDSCFEKFNKAVPATKAEAELPPEYLSSSLAQQSQAPPPRKSEEELQEEEELQLALALSKSEAEEKEKIKKKATNAILSGKARTYSPPPLEKKASPTQEEELDPELARYLNRDYWEQRQRTERSGPLASSPHEQPSAPVGTNTDKAAASTSPLRQIEKYTNGETDEIDEFVSALRGQVEIFVNRMKSNSSRGRSIANDSSVQTLFMNITQMHSQLLRFIQQQDDSRVYYEGLQDKLTQVKDARAALDALREEHRDKLRRAAEEAERQRQLQMAQKLEIMRKKKQEYLQYQRQLAMQRMQEQERELAMRQEQHKYMVSQQQMMPFGGAPQFIPTHPGFNPQGGPESSPVHGPYPPPGPQGPPTNSGPGPMPYPQGQPYPEYATYSMQGIPGGQPPPQHGPPPNQGVPRPMGPPPMQGPPTQTQGPQIIQQQQQQQQQPTFPQQPPPGGMIPPQQQQGPPPPQQQLALPQPPPSASGPQQGNTAELISFD